MNISSMYSKKYLKEQREWISPHAPDDHTAPAKRCFTSSRNRRIFCYFFLIAVQDLILISVYLP